jgi:hypothetical protein
MSDLSTLADRIATAGAANEAELFHYCLDLLGPPNGSAERARLERYVELGAYTDCALMLHRLSLPQHGFELGRTLASAFAGSWRCGDAQIATTLAATPALALLRATSSAMTSLRRESVRMACAICNGRGWYVTARSSKEICRHGII